MKEIVDKNVNKDWFNKKNGLVKQPQKYVHMI